MDLQTAFYIVGIVYMGLMLILFIALLIAVLVIKSKIDKVHDTITTRINQAKSIGLKANILMRTIRHFAKG
jgi:hypothetical protein